MKNNNQTTHYTITKEVCLVCMKETTISYNYKNTMRVLCFFIMDKNNQLVKLKSEETEQGLNLNLKEMEWDSEVITKKNLFLGEQIENQIFLSKLVLNDFPEVSFKCGNYYVENLATGLTITSQRIIKNNQIWLNMLVERVIFNQEKKVILHLNNELNELSDKESDENYYLLLKSTEKALAIEIPQTGGLPLTEIPYSLFSQDNEIALYFMSKVGGLFVAYSTHLDDKNPHFIKEISNDVLVIDCEKGIRLTHELTPSLKSLPVKMKLKDKSLHITGHGFNEVKLKSDDSFESITAEKNNDEFVFSSNKLAKAINTVFTVVGENEDEKINLFVMDRVSTSYYLEESAGYFFNQGEKIIYTTEPEENIYGKCFKQRNAKIELMDVQLAQSKLIIGTNEKLPVETVQLIIQKRHSQEFDFIPLQESNGERYTFFVGSFFETLDCEKKYYDIRLMFIANNTRYVLEPVIHQSRSSAVIGDFESVYESADEWKARLYITNNKGLAVYHNELELTNKFKMITKTSPIYVNNIYLNKEKLYIDFKENELVESGNTSVIFEPRDDTEKYNVPMSFETSGKAFIPISKLNSIFEKGNLRWDVLIQNDDLGYQHEGRARLNEKNQAKRSLSHIATSENRSLLVYTTDTNRLSVSINSSINNFREEHRIETEMLEISKKKNRLESSFKIKANQKMKLTSVFIRLRSDERDLKIPLNILTQKEKNNTIIAKVSLTMNWDLFFPLYWDTYAEVSINGEAQIVRITGSSSQVRSKVNKDYLNLSLINDDQIIYPYLTFGKDISFMIRTKEQYENKYVKALDLLGYGTYQLFKSHYDKKNIWLGFEKFSKTAQDNGFAFFDYVSKNKLENDFYYVLDKEATDFQEISRNHKNVLKHMSYRYFIYLYASKKLIASETPRHVHNIRIRSGRANQSVMDKQSIFLQHGVTAFKQSDVFRKAEGRGNFDLVIATSEIEKEIIRDNWLYDESEIGITGFARWDLLEDTSSKENKKIVFVMPTWRSWMEDMPKNEFIATDYFMNYMAFLNSRALHEILTKNDMEIVFFLHPKFKEYITEFKVENSDNIKFYSFGEIKVNEYIMKSSIMVSDYSSVTWDMFYLNKPVIFFQFDYEKYNQYEGSYLDMETDLFGDRVITVDELNESLKKIVQNNFNIESKYSSLREEYFYYTEGGNCERIYKAVKRLG